MDPARDRKSVRCNTGSSEPVVEESQRTGSASLEAQAASRCQAQTESGAASAITDLIGAGSRSLRFSWQGLDDSASGSDDQATVWSVLSSSPLQPPASRPQVESTKAHRKGHPAR